MNIFDGFDGYTHASFASECPDGQHRDQACADAALAKLNTAATAAHDTASNDYNQIDADRVTAYAASLQEFDTCCAQGDLFDTLMECLAAAHDREAAIDASSTAAKAVVMDAFGVEIRAAVAAYLSEMAECCREDENPAAL